MTFDELLKKIDEGNLIRMVFSKPGKDVSSQKMKVRPVVIKGNRMYQVTRQTGSKEEKTVREVFENLTAEQLKTAAKNVFPSDYKQLLFETDTEGFTVLSGKKGNITICANKSVSGKIPSSTHNKEKNYIISEGEYVPFLEDLGVMNAKGLVIKAKYDKFRQINRYLEFISDVKDRLPKDREAVIVDFGCGKSYLTFALYYFLAIKNNMRIRVIGLDLKPDVIEKCSKLRDKYGYDHLEFIRGDIEHFTSDNNVDMVISLHACDTATDYALYKGIVWNASIIMAVPCCQHELNRNIVGKDLSGVLQYGILKDRLCAVFTDAMRADLLKQWGYDTNVLEFIDMEHTPKNILIRAIKKRSMASKTDDEKLMKLRETVGCDITLGRLLDEYAKEIKA